MSYKVETKFLNQSEGWLKLKLPITGIKVMHFVTELPRNQCAPRRKGLKNPFFV